MSAPSALLSLLLVTALTVSAEATDYCTDITTCSDHTMCKYTTDGASSSCPKVLKHLVSDAQKTEIVEAHNAIRRAVKAGNYLDKNLKAAQTMPDLAWDKELAMIAQRFVDQCLSTPHDDCRNVEGFRVGQNAGSVMNYPATAPANWTAVVHDQWFLDELLKSPHLLTDLTYTNTSSPVGHTTQVIWADTEFIGCGYIAYEDTIASGGAAYYPAIHHIYVCNYGPGGNVIGDQIYQAA